MVPVAVMVSVAMSAAARVETCVNTTAGTAVGGTTTVAAGAQAETAMPNNNRTGSPILWKYICKHAYSSDYK
jgi:hypothetical protein